MNVANLKNFISKIRHYGCFIPVSNLIMLYGRKFLPDTVLRRISDKRNYLIQNKISDLIGTCLSDKNQDETQFMPNAPVWFCWLQGVDKMPLITRLCYESLKKHSNGHPVIFLDSSNYMDYVSIPEHIIDIYKSGKLKQAHFADIMRVMLLYQQGGLWIDATLLVVKDLPEYIFNEPFFSVKTQEYGYFVSKCRWAVFCLGGWPHNMIFQKVSDCFTEYLKLTDVFIDYFMFDQFIDMLYKRNNSIREMIDNVPYNNENIHKLSKILISDYDEKIYSELLSNTFMFKLSWKTFTEEELLSNPKNLYNHIKEDLRK